MENLLNTFEKMYLIRCAEETIAKHYLENKIFSFVHFYVGQEAVAVGVSNSLKSDDKVIGNHRSHGHYLAKGGNLFEMFSEMLGKATGCCKGKGGSMHMLDRKVGFMGSTPILSSGVPIAAGIALSEKFKQTNSIAVVYVGDGASEEGEMYETLNFASTLKIPLLVVLEDNLYSVNSPQRSRRSEDFEIADLSKSLGVKYFYANGNDIKSVQNSAQDATEYVRLNSKPALLHCKVFRHMAHSAPIMDDQIGYREIDTLEHRIEVDSVMNLRKELVRDFGEIIINDIEKSIEIRVQQELIAAIEAPLPNPDLLGQDVYAN